MIQAARRKEVITLHLAHQLHMLKRERAALNRLCRDRKQLRLVFRQDTMILLRISLVPLIHTVRQSFSQSSVLHPGHLGP